MSTKLTKQTLELIRRLALAFGPSGCEDAVAETLKELALEKGADSAETDALGNLIVRLDKSNGEAERKKLLFVTGMDEIGFFITERDGCYLRAKGVGRVDARALYSRTMLVGDDRKQTAAIFGGKPLHLAEGGERTNVEDNKLFLDPCVTSEDELKNLVQPGDFATFRGNFTTLGKDGEYLVCKALDVRCPCALLLETLETLQKDPTAPALDYYFVFAVKEQANMSGAAAAADRITPFAAISVGFAGDDRLGMENCRSDGAAVGDGVFLPLLDGGTLYYDSPLRSKALSLLKQETIPYREGKGCGNATGRLHLNRNGIPVLRTELPCRNPHTASVIVKDSDYLALRQLLTKLPGVCETL